MPIPNYIGQSLKEDRLNEASNEVTLLKTNLTSGRSSFSDEANEINSANVRLGFFK